MKYALSDTIHMVALDKIPIPVAGVALGTASLGNLLNAYSDTTHWLCFGITLLFILLLLGRLIVDPESIRRDLCDPVIAGVSGTFPMALMVMSTYISGSYYELALAIWGSAIIMHILLMIHYTRRFIIGMDMKKIFASTFIVYVGIAVAGVTSPFLDMRTIGSVTVYFGALVLIPLFVLITYRYIKCPGYPRPTFPLLCIYTAPVSLCIAGYMQSFDHMMLEVLIPAYILACVLYVFGLVITVRTIAMEFYPSYAALTFPLVISAIASKNMSSCLEGNMSEIVSVISSAETVICTMVVAYVVIRYLAYIVDAIRNDS